MDLSNTEEMLEEDLEAQQTLISPEEQDISDVRREQSFCERIKKIKAYDITICDWIIGCILLASIIGTIIIISIGK